MNTRKIPVLLTSSVIAHDTGVALKDTNARMELALESVREWLRIDPELRIVLCDGSGFDFSPMVAERFPHAAVESIHFDNNQEMVKEHGRGYGEGEIVRYALAHSHFIGEAGCFVKCTSKLWVENYAQCLQDWNGKLLLKGVFSNVFSPLRKTTLAYIDTRFYIASCNTYRKYFENAHLQIKREIGHGLEECFHDVFIKHRICHSLFSIPPVICGVGGGTGVYYRNPLMRRMKERLRLAVVRINRNFRHLFAPQ